MTLYTVNGSVADVYGAKFYVELLENDQHWFDDRVDDLLGSSWTDNDGKFSIQFEDSLYRESWLEGKPELFVRIRDEDGKELHQTKTKSPDSPGDLQNLTFDDIVISEKRTRADPYALNNNRRVVAFAGIGDAVNLTDDLANSSRLLLQTINAWLLYTNEAKWRAIGYDGPQVPRYPWREPSHTHKLGWNE